MDAASSTTVFLAWIGSRRVSRALSARCKRSWRRCPSSPNSATSWEIPLRHPHRQFPSLHRSHAYPFLRAMLVSPTFAEPFSLGVLCTSPFSPGPLRERSLRWRLCSPSSRVERHYGGWRCGRIKTSAAPRSRHSLPRWGGSSTGRWQAGTLPDFRCRSQTRWSLSRRLFHRVPHVGGWVQLERGGSVGYVPAWAGRPGPEGDLHPRPSSESQRAYRPGAASGCSPRPRGEVHTSRPETEGRGESMDQRGRHGQSRRRSRAHASRESSAFPGGEREAEIPWTMPLLRRNGSFHTFLSGIRASPVVMKRLLNKSSPSTLLPVRPRWANHTHTPAKRCWTPVLKVTSWTSTSLTSSISPS